MAIRTKRIYEPFSPEDGRRYLIDRLWPRGVSKDTAHVNEWLRDLAPSAELREWFSHKIERYPEFRKRYRDELQAKPALIARVREEGRKGTVTLLYAAKDAEHCNASVLRELLEG
jgi:uncharacterized protein YeaO (DUF488 family)